MPPHAKKKRIVARARVDGQAVRACTRSTLSTRRIDGTATPAEFPVRKTSKGETVSSLFDMSNEKIYGKFVHRLSFRDAIDLKLICGYKILVIEVDKEHAELKRILVDGDGSFAVLKGVAFLNGLVGKLALFTYGNKGGVELASGSSGENEPAGVDADHGVDSRFGMMRGEQID